MEHSGSIRSAERNPRHSISKFVIDMEAGDTVSGNQCAFTSITPNPEIHDSNSIHDSLFLAGCNGGSTGPLLPRIQKV